MREPHVRVHVGERAMTAWLLLDVSASMTFGTADRRKADVAEGVALAVGHVATRRGNRLGVVALGGGEPADPAPAPGPPRPARAARRAARRARGRRRRRDLARHRASRSTAALARNRGLIVVVSDFRGEQDWEGPLRTLRARHGVLAVEIRDPREHGAPAGRRPLAHRSGDRPPAARQHEQAARAQAVRAAAAAERAEVAAALRRVGADHLVLSTEGDWLQALAGHLRRSELRVRAGGEGGRPMSFREPVAC